jgi:hypothetical protein
MTVFVLKVVQDKKLCKTEWMVMARIFFDVLHMSASSCTPETRRMWCQRMSSISLCMFYWYDDNAKIVLSIAGVPVHRKSASLH